jgi:hypothetical protein
MLRAVTLLRLDTLIQLLEVSRINFRLHTPLISIKLFVIFHGCQQLEIS